MNTCPTCAYRATCNQRYRVQRCEYWKEEIVYRIIKQEEDGTIYEVERATDQELIVHLQATFQETKHKVLAVINISPRK